ncbi:hypothetical protein M441DRAFT_31924 [Trichoderma asperellum CBS 433.97]|uniref:Uncharacterized protein n=1 Tax=Trichoderma asperellum (strain ATCC 204424 / CBS 433.97 / NBRC 101777) TaxID=1042311 RepID=A0A2T3YSB4_TRIA4|nr:hypothetical protein M441DRAFT_31924 [Trichoderma asperellum CBS 433.97]PTB35458.1 hypothetical protein M441DRAFT_31924 [Trichoderma asperellum CBS 433.97]
MGVWARQFREVPVCTQVLYMIRTVKVGSGLGSSAGPINDYDHGFDGITDGRA